jgi:hypothetical protein
MYVVTLFEQSDYVVKPFSSVQYKGITRHKRCTSRFCFKVSAIGRQQDGPTSTSITNQSHQFAVRCCGGRPSSCCWCYAGHIGAAIAPPLIWMVGILGRTATPPENQCSELKLFFRWFTAFSVEAERIHHWRRIQSVYLNTATEDISKAGECFRRIQATQSRICQSSQGVDVMKLWSDKIDQGLLRSRLWAGVTKNTRGLTAVMLLSSAGKHNVP